MEREEIEELIERLDRRSRAHEYFAQRVSVKTGEEAHTEASDDFRDARDALRHLLQAQRWRPISEAPKDGNAFLAYGRHTHSPKDAQRGVKAGDHWWAIILWDIWRPEEDGGRAWVFAKDGQYTWSTPTHFLPLPSPPSSFEEPTTEATPSDQQNEGEA